MLHSISMGACIAIAATSRANQATTNVITVKEASPVLAPYPARDSLNDKARKKQLLARTTSFYITETS